MAESQNKFLLYAVAACAVIALAALGYAAMQGGSFDKRAAQFEQGQTAANAKLDAANAAIAQMNSRLDEFDAYIKARLADLEVTLTVYYDSDCTFCQNDELFKVLDQVEPDFKKNGVTINRVDVRSDYENILASGIDRVPAFYASTSDLQKQPAGAFLKSQMDGWEQSGFDYYLVKDGVIEVPRPISEMLTEPCLSGKTVLQYFYSQTCKACKRVENANGTIVNPPDKQASTAGEALAQLESVFGAALDVKPSCVGTKFAYDNYREIGVNKSDEELCLATQTPEKTYSDKAQAAKYHFAKVPMFAVNCRYLFTGFAPEIIKERICAAKPSLDACKTGATAGANATASATPKASAAPSASATPNASPTPAPSAAPSAAASPNA